MGLATAALIGGGLAGSLIGARSSDRAADQVSGAADAATAEQRRQFNIATGLARPAIDSGNIARAQLMRLLGLNPISPQAANSGLSGGFMTNPNIAGFGGLPASFRNQFGLDGQFGRGGAPGAIAPPSPSDPLDIIRQTPGYQFQLEEGRSAINADRSLGGTSGGTLIKDFARFNQGTASSFYQDYANRLAGLAGSAQTASTQLGGLGVQSGQGVANTLLGAGQARASGIIGQGNAYGGFLNQLGGAAGLGLLDNIFSGNNPATRRPGP